MARRYVFSEHYSTAEQKNKSVYLWFDGLILLASLTIFSLILASQPTGTLRAELAKSETFQTESIDGSSVALNQLLIGVQPNTTDNDLRTLLAARGMNLIKR